MSLKEEQKIKHLSIEGFDGVGKTTICNKIAKILNFKFVTKPFSLLCDNLDNYVNIRTKINKNTNYDLTTWFYCLSYGFSYSLNENIVTDRFYGSNYAWGGNSGNDEIFELAIKKFGKPDLTIILYANQETIKNRLLARDENDSNLPIVNKSESYYKKMKHFFNKENITFKVIDTSNLTINETIKEVIELWKKNN